MMDKVNYICAFRLFVSVSLLLSCMVPIFETAFRILCACMQCPTEISAAELK